MYKMQKSWQVEIYMETVQKFIVSVEANFEKKWIFTYL